MIQGIIHNGRAADGVCTDHVVITALEEIKGTCAAISYRPGFPMDGKEYVFLPACCYNGNRFASLKKEYPPMFEAEEASPDMPVTITDVIRQNMDGTGEISVTTGDVSVPCIGIFSPVCQKAVLLYTVQKIGRHNLGLSCHDGVMEIQYPHFRQGKQYRAFSMIPKSDPGMDFEKGEEVVIPYRIFEWDCPDMEAFYHKFMETRKCMGMDATLPEVPSPKRQWEIQREKFNAQNYREKGGFYGVGITPEPTQTWQPGWVGGGMSSYALMKLGNGTEWDRGMSTLAHLFRTQGPSGLFYGVCSEEGEIRNDAFGHAGVEDWVLIRKSADVLYFVFKHFRLIREKGCIIPEEFTAGARRLADRFVALWKQYGQFGQFVDVKTGEIRAGGSTSAAIAPAGLVCAYEFWGDPVYLETAKESARLFYTRDASRGYTTGGPGEILQGPDSESAFGLLESFVKLYEVTGEKEWLDRSVFMADFGSSWVVCYNYEFPADCEFGRLGMKTVGSVFANVQNKHSAPGICTLSGDSLYKVYQWTGEEKYLELLREIALTISQYMSREDRPIYSWDDVPQKLPSGVICERVNLSDWEGERGIGGVFNGSCWCETSHLLTLAEVMPLFGMDLH